MADDLLSGRVTSFRLEQGFGVITLDDGREVKFDSSICKGVPEEGAPVAVRVGPARWGGGLKALHVEPRDAPAFVVSRTLTLDQQIATLQREHLVASLSEHVMAQLIAEAFGGELGDATLLDVIDAFYVQDGARARHDGYLRRVQPFRHDASDILAEIAALLPDARIPRQLAKTRAATGAVQPTLGIESLPLVIDLVNDSLRAAGDARRLYPLDTRGDFCAYLVLSADRARRLAGVLPFARPPQEIN